MESPLMINPKQIQLLAKVSILTIYSQLIVKCSPLFERLYFEIFRGGNHSIVFLLKGTLEREISQEMWMYNVTSLKFWSGSTAGIYKKLGK